MNMIILVTPSFKKLDFRRRQRYRLHEAKCNSPKADTTVSPPAEGMSQKDAGPDRRDVAEEDGKIDEDLQDLEDSDAASLQDFVDRNDEELMLEAAIAQERHAQQFLTGVFIVKNLA